MSNKPKLLEQVRQTIRLKHYSYRTEQSYVGWIRRFILYHNKRHPREMGKAEVEAFLNHLATDRNVAASTQNQALNALLFLYSEVLDKPLPNIDSIRAKKPKRLPVVLTRAEVQAVLKQHSQHATRPAPRPPLHPRTAAYLQRLLSPDLCRHRMAAIDSGRGLWAEPAGAAVDERRVRLLSAR